MGSIVLYIIEWAFALIVLLTIYKAAFSGTTFYRFNRFYLLGATLLSALLPLVHITIPEKAPVVSDIAIENMDFAQELSGTFILIGEPDVTAADPVQPQKQSSLWAVILVCTYTAYVIMLLTGWIRSIIRARKFLRGKDRRRISRTVWLVTHDEEFGPFSWMNYIVISDTESGFARRASLRHEYSHVRLLHSVDLVFLLACTIFNPVCWLVLQEIKIVHEYEADNEVINRYGIRNSDYQKLLIMRTVGAEAYALASSFNLNIKKRIIMMNKNKTRKRRLMWLLLLLPLLGMTSVLFARTEESIGPDELINLSLSYDKDGKEDVETQSVSQLIGKIRIHGRVVDENGDPIESAMLGIALSESSTTITGSSDSNGRFTFDALKGDIIVIEKQGYLPMKIMADEFSSELTVTLHSATQKTIDSNSGNNMSADELEQTTEIPPQIKDPEFPGGVDAMMQYLRMNVHYPAECRDSSIQGSVLVTFIINKDGEIVEPEVVRSVHPLLDAEALRVINAMPNWTPGIHNGKPVRFKYSIPVNFVLENNVRNSAPAWIYIYDVNEDRKGETGMDDELLSALLSSANSNLNDLELSKTPEVKALMQAFKSAQSEVEAKRSWYNDEMNKIKQELDELCAEIESQRDTLSESQLAARDQELMDLNAVMRERFREIQKEFTDWSNMKSQSLQPLVDAAWNVILQSGAYACVNLPDVHPDEKVIITPDNMDAALQDLFEGRRAAIAIRYSDNDYQQLRTLLSQKYADKAVFYTKIR